MTTDIATLGIRVDSSQVGRASTELDRLQREAQRTENAIDAMRREISDLLSPLRAMQALMAGIVAAMSVRRLIEYADTWTLLSARIRIATNSSREYVVAQQELFRISQQTRTSLESNVTLYARIATVAQRAGRSQQDVIRFTEVISKGIQLSGASAEEAQSAVIQLAQALASGRLQGEEFRSLAENASGLVQALADNVKGVDGNIGKMREFSEQGKLTFDVIFNAALRAGDAIDKKYAQIPVTVAQSFTTLENAITKYVGETSEAINASKTIAGAIQGIGENFDTIANSIGAMATVLTAALIGRSIPAITAFATQVQFAAATQIELARDVAVVAAAEKAEAQTALSAAAAKQTQAAATLASTQATRADLAATLALAESQRAYQAAMVAQAKGIVEATGRTGVLTKAQDELNERTKAVIATRRALAAVDTQVAASQLALAEATTVAAAAEARATVATTAHAAAIQRTGIVATASALAMRGFSSVVAFLGGPVGAALTVAAGAAYYLATAQSAAEKAAEKHAEALAKIKDAGQKATGQMDALNNSLRQQQIALEKQAEIRKAMSDAQDVATELKLIDPTSTLDAFTNRDYYNGLLDIWTAFRDGKTSIDDYEKSLTDLGTKFPDQYDKIKPLIEAIQAYRAALLDAAKAQKELAAAPSAGRDDTLAYTVGNRKIYEGTEAGVSTGNFNTSSTELTKYLESLGLVIDKGKLVGKSQVELQNGIKSVIQALRLAPGEFAKFGVSADEMRGIIERLTEKLDPAAAAVKELADESKLLAVPAGYERDLARALEAARDKNGGVDLTTPQVTSITSQVQQTSVDRLKDQTAELERNAQLQSIVAKAAAGTAEQQAAAARTVEVYNAAMSRYGTEVANAVLAGKPLPADLQAFADALKSIDLAKRAGEMGTLAAQTKLQADAQLRLAQAAGLGEAAIRAANAENEIAAARSRSAAEEAQARAKAVRDEAAAVLSAKNQSVSALDMETESNLRMATALQQGGDAVAKAEREEFRLTRQRVLGKNAVAELNAELEAYDRNRESKIAKDMAGQAGRDLQDIDTEISRLKERNALLNQQAAGGAAGVAAGVKVAEYDAKIKIDDEVLSLQRKLQDMQKSGIEVDIEGKTKALKTELETQDALEKRVKTQELASNASDSLGNVFSRIESGDWGSVAEGVGKFVGDFKALETQTGSATQAFSEMGKSLLNSAEAGNALGNIMGSIFGRDADQKKNANIGGGVGGTIGSFFGMKGLGSFIGNIAGGLFGGNAKEDEYWYQRSQELTDLGEGISDFISSTANISGTQQNFRDLESSFAELRAEAERLGQPVEELTAAYEAQFKALQTEVSDSILDVLDSLTGNEAMADYRALAKTQQERIDDALEAEVSLGLVRAANAAELSAFFEELSLSQIEAMGELASQLDIVKARIRDLTDTLSTQIDDQIDLSEQLAESARTQAAAYRSLATSLREQVLDNLTGDLSPLSPQDQYSTLLTEFERLYALAQSGDLEAGQSLSSAGTDLLSAAKELYSTGPEYVAIFNQVQEALSKVGVNADVRATGFDRLAEAADVQTEILSDIRDLLSSDLGGTLSSAVTGGVADGSLTTGEVTSINNALTTLSEQFTGVGGEQAQAVRDAIAAMQPLVTAGALTDTQKTALTDGQQAIADALTNFTATQLAQYQDALVAAGEAISAIENFILDPDGKIPAAIDAAFNNGVYDQTLVGRIDNLFREALGEDQLSLPLSGQVYDLFGRAIGDSSAIGDSLTVRAGMVLGTAIGEGLTVDSLSDQAAATIDDALGVWTQTSLSTRMNDAIGAAIGDWTAGENTSTLTQRINSIFTLALGATEDSTWQGELKSMLDSASPIVTNLGTLALQVAALTTAMGAQAANDNAQAAYDAGLQAYVTPVKAAAATAQGTLSGIKDVESANGKMVSSWLGVDATTGAIVSSGGKGSDSTSDSRAQELASALSDIASQIETLTGGDIGTFTVNASNKYGSGYQIGDIDKAQAFGINDFEGIARSFILDALSTLTGGSQEAIDVLKSTSFADLTTGFVTAAQQIYALSNPAKLADGGLVTGGIAGVDSVPAMLMPGERVLSVDHSSMLNTIYQAAAGSSQGQVVTDPALLEELRALRASNERMEASNESMREELASYRKEQGERDAKLIKAAEGTARGLQGQAGGVKGASK